jgi:uncharacterized membrane protein
MKKSGRQRKPRYASPRHASIGRVLTLVGYFGLLLLIVNWFTWMAPPVQVPRSLILAALAIPLLFPLRGILHARRYTHQWIGFLSMFYFIIGVDVWFNQQNIERMLGICMVIFSLMLLAGSSMYSRYTPTPPEQRKSAEEP